MIALTIFTIIVTLGFFWAFIAWLLAKDSILFWRNEFEVTKRDLEDLQISHNELYDKYWKAKFSIVEEGPDGYYGVEAVDMPLTNLGNVPKQLRSFITE